MHTARPFSCLISTSTYIYKKAQHKQENPQTILRKQQNDSDQNFGTKVIQRP